MPAQYEAMRDKFIRDGLSRDEAETKAAKIYNSKRKKGQPTLFDYIKNEEK